MWFALFVPTVVWSSQIIMMHRGVRNSTAMRRRHMLEQKGYYATHENKLMRMNLVMTHARSDRLFLSRRYERVFMSTVYLNWEGEGLTQAECLEHQVACVFGETAADGYRHLNVTGDGVLFLKLDTWLQPVPFSASSLSLDRPWVLAAGMVSNEAVSSTTCQGDECIGASELFYVPKDLWKDFVKKAPTFANTETAVHTLLKNPLPIECWGCASSKTRDPTIVERFFCGHKLDLDARNINVMFRNLLDDQFDIVVKSMPNFQRNEELDSAILYLDHRRLELAQTTATHVSHGPKTTRCCALPSHKQTSCSCVAASAAYVTSGLNTNTTATHCDAPDLVRPRSWYVADKDSTASENNPPQNVSST